MLAAWNQAKQARCTTCGSCSPPTDSSIDPASSPDSANAVSARATSGMMVTFSPSKVGSSASFLRLWVANSRSASVADRSSTASKVSRECSANRGRAVRPSTPSHS